MSKKPSGGCSSYFSSNGLDPDKVFQCQDHRSSHTEGRRIAMS